MATTPSNSPSSTARAPFASKPQKYPKTQRMAAQVVNQMHRLVQKGPRTLVGTVIDTSFLPSMGYVLCTTQLGVVNVYGVPMGTVVPQMRLFCRQIGPAATNKGYVFDGFAPSLSSRSLTSGSLLSSTTNGDSGTPLAVTTTGGIPSVASLTTAVGYYWHFFFYVPTLPAIPRVTLFSMETSGGTNILACEYLSTGYLVFRCTNDGTGYTSVTIVSPHVIHWVQVQPGLAGGLELLVDGIASYSTTTNIPTFAGAGATYTGSFLSRSDGSQQCPPGTWISKFGYGTSYTSSAVVTLSTGVSVPQSDADLPNLNISTTQTTQALYLLEEGAGATSSVNSSAAGTASVITVNAPYSAIVDAGPY